MTDNRLSATQQMVIRALGDGPAGPAKIRDRANLYNSLRPHTITALLNHELIQIDTTDPDADFADMVYSLTPAGAKACLDLMDRSR